MTKTISIIIPILNEEKCLEELYSRINHVTVTVPYRFEFIFIDDGSTDHSFRIIEELRGKDERVKGCKFSRNFGHQMALLCGIETASGDAVIMMDADLQHPPELLTQMIQQWENGIPIVNMVRRQSQNEIFFKKATAFFFYKIFCTLTGLKIENTADFRLIDKKVADHIRGLSETTLFLRGMINWVGFRQVSIDYEAAPRFAGRAKYNFKKMIEFGVDGLTSFSVLPLRFATLLGLGIIVGDFAYLFYTLFVYFFLGGTQKGWTSVVFIISVYSSIQIFLIGLVGEYIAKIHLESKRRPRYIVEQVI